MELYEQLGYTEATLETIRLRLDMRTQHSYLNLIARGLKDTANNILALSDVINKIDAGETVDTSFNLVQTRDNAVLLKENEKQQIIECLQILIEATKKL